MQTRLVPHRASSRSGFTLVELMIVVVIMGILAAVAGPLYMRQRYRSQAIEATELLTQIVHAQEGYRAEFNVYSDASNDAPLTAVTVEGTRGSLGTWWPALGAPASAGGMVDFYVSLPASWNQLSVRPRQFVRYSLQTIAGNPGVVPSVGASGDLGYAALPLAQQGQWFYATASGDLNANGVYSRFEVSSLRRELTIIGSETE